MCHSGEHTIVYDVICDPGTPFHLLLAGYPVRRLETFAIIDCNRITHPIRYLEAREVWRSRTGSHKRLLESQLADVLRNENVDQMDRLRTGIEP